MQDKPKFFGRRKGRTIHKAKSFLLEKFLPRVSLKSAENIELSKCFATPKAKYCLEIGFGDGEHLAGIAKSQPQNGFIGVEVFKNGVANLLILLTGLKEGREEGSKEGLEKGREEGERKKALTIAKRLKAMGMSDDDIASATD